MRLYSLRVRRGKGLPELFGGDGQFDRIHGCAAVNIQTRLWGFIRRWNFTHFVRRADGGNSEMANVENRANSCGLGGVDLEKTQLLKFGWKWHLVYIL
jgi:hypothetical protein